MELYPIIQSYVILAIIVALFSSAVSSRVNRDGGLDRVSVFFFCLFIAPAWLPFIVYYKRLLAATDTSVASVDTALTDIYIHLFVLFFLIPLWVALALTTGSPKPKG